MKTGWTPGRERLWRQKRIAPSALLVFSRAAPGSLRPAASNLRHESTPPKPVTLRQGSGTWIAAVLMNSLQVGYSIQRMQRREFLMGAMAAPLKQSQLDQALALIAQKTSSGEVSEAASAGAARRRDRRLSQARPRLPAGLDHQADDGHRRHDPPRPRPLRLDDPVRKFIPEFTGGDRDLITIRHLLTHTSGLPDMLPDNTELRKRHAPLSDFVAGVCKTPLLFKPGAEVRYQSMGILLAGEIVERVARARPARISPQGTISAAGMKETSLGLGGRKIADTALCQVAGDDDWNWNSPYWRDLGAPWGGAHSTAADVRACSSSFCIPTAASSSRRRPRHDRESDGPRGPLGPGLDDQAGHVRQGLLARDVRPLRLDGNGGLGRSEDEPHVRPADHQAGGAIAGRLARPGV